MKDNFDACFSELLTHEGGFVDDPRDAGGETNMGISRAAYPKEDIRNLTRERAAYLYRRDYWAKVKGDDLPAGLDLVSFDAAVNSGVSRGAKWLQTALGVTDDGSIGPNTIAAAKAAQATAVIDRACDLRLAWLRTAKNSKTGARLWPTYGKGWTRRVESIRETAHAMSTASNETREHAIQSALAGLVPYTGKIDGIWGPKSQAALDAFNRARDRIAALSPEI